MADEGEVQVEQPPVQEELIVEQITELPVHQDEETQAPSDSVPVATDETPAAPVELLPVEDSSTVEATDAPELTEEKSAPVVDLPPEVVEEPSTPAPVEEIPVVAVEEVAAVVEAPVETIAIEEVVEETGLRQRKESAAPAPEQPTAPTPTTQDDGDDNGKVKRKEGFVGKLLKTYLPQVLNALGYVELVFNIVIVVSSHTTRLIHIFYKKFEAYLPDQIVKCITGLVLMFFGGFFITTVACIEAIRQGGYDRLVKSLNTLRQEAKTIAEANEADNQIDEDGDGIADVLQISQEELTQRKLLVFIRACNPNEVSEALSALYTCFLAVIATLRVKFARTISLGAAIGDNLYKPVHKFVIPVLEMFTSKDYHKWYPSIFGYICRATGASIAFQIQRILSTVATSVRGGHMVIESTAVLSQHLGHSYLTDGFIDDILVWILVALGIYFQIFIFTFLPFIVKLILTPFFLFEWVMTMVVTFTA